MEWPFILLLCLGALCLVLGALIAVMRVRTIYFGAKAEGTIVGHSESTSTSRSGGSTRMTTMYSPIVEFHHGGKKIKFTSSMGTQARLEQGSKVVVRYLPDQPETSAEIGTGVRMWSFPIVALAVGSIFIAVALWGAGYLGGAPK